MPVGTQRTPPRTSWPNVLDKSYRWSSCTRINSLVSDFGLSPFVFGHTPVNHCSMGCLQLTLVDFLLEICMIFEIASGYTEYNRSRFLTFSQKVWISLAQMSAMASTFFLASALANMCSPTDTLANCH